MFQFRPFQNADPPALAEVWRSQPPQRGLMQPMSARLLEICVYARQYFDPQGFVVATQDEVPVGFVHAGFGPDSSGGEVATGVGVIEMAMVHSRFEDPSLENELLSRGEEYLRTHGAKRVLAGARKPYSQFYLGLYGGSELPGVLVSDLRQTEMLKRNGYVSVEEVAVLQRDLVSFRPPFSREQRWLRREVDLRADSTQQSDTWWEAHQRSEQEVIRFELIHRGDEAVWASVSCWDIEPLATSWGAPTVGLFDLQTTESQRRRGVATYLLSEAFRELRVRGVAIVECQLNAANEPMMALAKKLGFSRVDTGHVYEKPE